MLKTKKLPWQPLLFFDFKSFLLPDYTRFEHIRKIEENWNQSQTDVKKWRCVSSFNLRLKALISEVTVEQQILVLVCYVSVALIRKIAKRTRILTFDWGHWRALSQRHSTDPINGCKARPQRTSFSIKDWIFGVSYLLAPRVHCAFIEG